MDQAVELETLIESVPQATLAAKLRALMPVIDRRIKEGVSHQDIVDALNRHGGLATPVKLETFRSYLVRYRRKTRATPVNVAARGRGGARVERGDPPVSHPLVRNASDLKRLRNQEIDLDELSRLGKSQQGG